MQLSDHQTYLIDMHHIYQADNHIGENPANNYRWYDKAKLLSWTLTVTLQISHISMCLQVVGRTTAYVKKVV